MSGSPIATTAIPSCVGGWPDNLAPVGVPDAPLLVLDARPLPRQQIEVDGELLPLDREPCSVAGVGVARPISSDEPTDERRREPRRAAQDGAEGGDEVRLAHHARVLRYQIP